MRSFRGRLLGLCLTPVVLTCLDAALTLLGQSPEYWAGDYSRVNEGSPTFNQLLSHHPLSFIAGIAVWMIVYIGLILLSPQTLALAMSIVVTLGHTLGSCTWLLYRFHFGYQACLGLCALAAMALATGIRWGWRAEPKEDCTAVASRPLVRWAIIAALLAVAIYLFLWPRTP